MLSPLFQEHNTYFHFFMSSLVAISNILKFSSHISYSFLVKLIIHVATINGIFSPLYFLSGWAIFKTNNNEI